MFNRYEYRHVTLNGDDAFLTHALTKVGEEGWRVHSITRQGGNNYILLERKNA
jgi:hypothetical protein